MTTTASPVAGVVERPALFDLLERGVQGPVTLVCAPAGSGKTMLVRSWLESRGPSMPVAWTAVPSEEADSTRFWGAVTDALRRSGAVAADDPLSTLASAPMGGQREFLARLIEGLERLSSPVLLILDDLEQLRSDEALDSLGHLIGQAPAQLRCLLLSRSEPKVGLHRLRLSGGLTELRPAELTLTADEAAALLLAAGAEVSPEQVRRLHERTEGWAAGLRLAALALARHPDPAQFVDEFSGSEWTIAEYLGGELLARQTPEVRDLLLRTSILERVSGPLADHLTGRSDGARMLHGLDDANALVMSVDVARSWYRYHRLLVDFLRGELEREAAAEIPSLHRHAAVWLAEHGQPIEAVRHAQHARDWELAAELLGRHWVGLLLDGEETTIASLLGAFPPERIRADAELAAIAAADHLAASRWEEADALLAAAEAAPRRRRADTAVATVKLIRARQLGDLASVVDGAAAALARGDPDAGDIELRALAHANLGVAYGWTLQLDAAEEHLTKGLSLGRRIGSPYVEILCLNGVGLIAILTQRYGLAEELFRHGVSIAERVGWTTHPNVGVTFLFLAQVLVDRGRFAEAGQWLERAEPVLREAPEPAAVIALYFAKGTYAFARGQFADALAAFREGERLSGQLRAPFFLTRALKHWQLRAQMQLGDLEAMRAALADADGGPEWSNLEARLRLAEGDPEAAAAAVAPALDAEWPLFLQNVRIEAHLLDGIARLALGDPAAAQRSAERALDISGAEGRVWIYRSLPGVRELLEAHPMHATAQPAHLKELLDHAAGIEPSTGDVAAPTLSEPLTDRELAVLRFLPTNLSAPEIASELILSVHTVKTHMRKLYAKLDAHTRAEAVQTGRALGLLAPARRR
jgi:LuxR family transcriptional regulator, maltose regulon positive regulatory protein